MILIVGATGVLGGEICRLLVESGHPVRALARPSSDAARVDRLRALGAEIARGDLRDRDSLAAACRGARVVISTAATTGSRQPGDSFDDTDRQGQVDLVDAAREAGVEQFVFISFSGNIDVDSPFARAKRDVEEHLRRSGLTYTVLRPSVFMETWLGPATGFDAAGGRVTVLGSGDQPISYISLHDVARFAVACVDNPHARNATIELGGPEAVSPNEVVRTFEAVRGAPIEVQRVPVEALEAQYGAAQDPMQKTFAALMLGVALGDPIPMDETLRRIPVPGMLTVREYARRSLGG